MLKELVVFGIPIPATISATSTTATSAATAAAAVRGGARSAARGGLRDGAVALPPLPAVEHYLLPQQDVMTKTMLALALLWGPI